MQSILDNDLYKFTMQNAVLALYPNIQVTYRFKNRNLKQAFTKEAFDILQARVNGLSELVLHADEEAWMKTNLPFPESYFTYLKNYRFHPEEHIAMTLGSDGGVSIDITGLWTETILYEVPILALISETYFAYIDTDWSFTSQLDLANTKISRLVASKIVFSDFGTRRRRNFETQNQFDACLKEAIQKHGAGCGIQGTSNVYLAYKHGLKPIGTMAHEWIMAASALVAKNDIAHSNRAALETWRQVYPKDFGIALTDTYGTDVFFADFSPELTRDFDGVRQDSGNPKVFVDAFVAHCARVGVDVGSKVVVFSDNLNVDYCLELEEYCQKKGVVARYGIGTHFTNDYKKASSPSEKSAAMNIVMKLHEVDGIKVIKLSDDASKHTGDAEALAKVLDAIAAMKK
ncbi:nicotinate phosphoribosyltransferase [Synchytrium microbalum]|uniref:Nicotinate phosphoribosyltransferase n=1 Tax=Synchytrium microbalum TaxID=1806994 RepID=A0A507CG10_9FUNG|nr:nicotinate phosphoribosyltransferase [Synchytrium microbalum]TPX38119.1 nicotinate phosphoribosyltransferase [Synchytrium microbalum]